MKVPYFSRIIAGGGDYFFFRTKGGDYSREGDYFTGSRALKIFFYYAIKSKINHIKFTERGMPGGGGYLRNFWVGMCRWDPGTLNLY